MAKISSSWGFLVLLLLLLLLFYGREKLEAWFSSLSEVEREVEQAFALECFTLPEF